jgi:hypothetical protein
MNATTMPCQDFCAYVNMGTPHLSLLSQSYEDDYMLAKGRFKTDFERETELSMVSPEFPRLVRLRNVQVDDLGHRPTIRCRSVPE